MKNILKEEKNSVNTKMIVIYTIAITGCVLAVITTIIALVMGSESMGPAVGNLGGSNDATGEYVVDVTDEELLSNFEQMYTNSVEIKSISVDANKVNDQKELVYSAVSEKRSEAGMYEVEIDVPHINIDNEAIENLNAKYISIYVAKAKNIIEQSDNSRILLKYRAVVEKNILSLIIYTELKQGDDPQKLMIETVNYDLVSNKIITLEEYIGRKEKLTKELVQAKIDEGITAAQKADDVLSELGYEVYTRDVESEIYYVEKTSFFYVEDEILYIVYPYGNIENTRKKDVIIIRM